MFANEKGPPFGGPLLERGDMARSITYRANHLRQ
jgi:hypothetical protein